MTLVEEISTSHIAQVEAWLKTLQDEICQQVEVLDGQAQFHEDLWTHANGGGGRTRVLRKGAIFEQAGIGFSCVSGNQLPPSATANRPDLANTPWRAMGVSLVFHPHNPYVPTTHMNVRLFVSLQPENPIWWFGGGFDLTPFYVFEEDAKAWHQAAHQACLTLDHQAYERFKKWCDEYFYLKHRQETRGIGGIFFDDLNQWPFQQCFNFLQSVGQGFMKAYVPIVQRRQNHPYGERERQFQLYRRGRYVEFNLVWDRGTLFGLQSGGRTESILMSMPPLARWEYGFYPDPNSNEAQLAKYLQPRDWI